EMGNHTQLLAQGGLYQRLWQHYQQAQHRVPGGTQEEVVENERQ
ncbi:ABC transporter ATP-binding protein/permease, partial [Klebsiella pneumoniae]